MPDAASTTTATPTDAAAPPDAFLVSIRDTVTRTVADAVAPLTQRQSDLEGSLKQALRPNPQAQAQAAGLFNGGGAPYVRQGEDSLSSRGYSIGRLMFALATRDPDSAKLEFDIHRRLHDSYGGTLGRGSVLVPLGGRHLNNVDDSLRRECQQAMRQGVMSSEWDELRSVVSQLQANGHAVNQGLSTWSDTDGGALLGSVQEGELITLLRSMEVVSQLGASEITLPPNGRLIFPTQTGGATAEWVGESQTIPSSDVTTGVGVTMTAKKLAAMITMPNELIRFSNGTIEAFLRRELATVMSLKLDLTALAGAAGSALAPTGVINTTGVLTHTASTVGTNGNTLEPQDVMLMVAKVAERNVPIDNFSFAARPTLWAGVTTRRADALTEGDEAGPFVFVTTANQTGRPGGAIHGYRVVPTTQVPADRIKGSGTTLTMLIGGVWREMLVGRSGVLELAMDPYAGVSGSNFKQDLTTLRAIQHVDTVVRRPEAFVYCDQLLNS